MLSVQGSQPVVRAEPHALGHRARGAARRVVSLIGRNGVGKTTLLGCLMGLLKTDSGSITFDGRELVGIRAERRAPLGIGFVPQGRMIFPLLTVEENLRIGFPHARAARRKRKHTLPCPTSSTSCSPY